MRPAPAITDRSARRTERGHDELGRLVAETDPLGRTTRFRYDAAGRPAEQLDPTGGRRPLELRQLRPARPRHRRADGRRSPSAGPLGQPVRITETGAEPIELRWDPDGRLAGRRAGDRAVGWSYDADGLRPA